MEPWEAFCLGRFCVLIGLIVTELVIFLACTCVWETPFEYFLEHFGWVIHFEEGVRRSQYGAFIISQNKHNIEGCV